MNSAEVLAKIEEVKSEFAGKLDEIAAAVNGEESAAENPIPEENGEIVPEGGEGVAPVVPEEKKMLFGKKKPGGNDMRAALGI